MRTLGIKLTHDASYAIFDNDKLVICVEAEKIDNAPRYSKFPSLEKVEELVGGFNQFDGGIYIDGWKHGTVDHIPETIRIADYMDVDGRCVKGYLCSGNRWHAYKSYSHVLGHVIGSFAASPFSEKENCYVVVWDGGMNPRIYALLAGRKAPVYISSPHIINGIIYGIASYYFGPYKKKEVFSRKDIPAASETLFGGYSTPGKLMGWKDKGAIDRVLIRELDRIHAVARAHHPYELEDGYRQGGRLEHHICKELMNVANLTNVTDEVAFNSLHTWLERGLVDGLIKTVPNGANLIFTGGSALNIKYNSAIFREGRWNFWVPPFPNDSGSGFGAAAAGLHFDRRIRKVKWSVFSGPTLPAVGNSAGWEEQSYNPQTIIDALWEGEVVIRLVGKAELGPRALGARSLLASPFVTNIKEALNQIKGREDWRPVAPIILAEDYYKLFKDGPANDPFMLYDHEQLHNNLPGIMHFDNSARVQIASEEDKGMIELLREWKDETGFGILCNTSANFKGAGFFSDFQSAATFAQENGIKYIIYDNKLMVRKLDGKQRDNKDSEGTNEPRKAIDEREDALSEISS